MTVKVEELLDQALRDYLDCYPRKERPQLSEIVEYSIASYLQYLKKLKGTKSESTFKIALTSLDQYEKLLQKREDELSK